MRRTSIMTMGFVLIFIGIQLNLVETYVLTPRFSNFLSENGVSDPSTGHPPTIIPNGMVNLNNNNQQNIRNTPYNSPYYQASFPQVQPPQFSPVASLSGQAKTFSPPKWLCWPVLFLGAVLFLQGLAMQRHSD